MERVFIVQAREKINSVKTSAVVMWMRDSVMLLRAKALHQIKRLVLQKSFQECGGVLWGILNYKVVVWGLSG
jgi:hypothetical protein